MKLVKQEDRFGCAVACVAFVMNIKYKNARKLFKNGEKRAKNSGFYCREIIVILRNAGLNYRYKYIKPEIRRQIYKLNTIAFIKRSKKYCYGHYLVKRENKWMDPWINLPDKNIKAGFRKRLPGKAIYAIFQ